MADRRQILGLLLAGRTARQITAELRMPPSKLRRALAGRRMREALSLEQAVADAGRILRPGGGLDAAAGQRAARTRLQTVQAIRKARRTIIETLPGERRGGISGPDRRETAVDSRPQP